MNIRKETDQDREAMCRIYNDVRIRQLHWIDSFIHHLFVDSTFQGRGTGERLLNFAIELYPSSLKLKCLTVNKIAIRFYKKMGGIVLEEGDSEDGSYYLIELRKPKKSVDIEPASAVH